eukprot:m.47825 g.47825  ORF g.47825 m.47825 type:complete len:360 (+) comp33835_c0_seq1:464-1543(+)
MYSTPEMTSIDATAWLGFVLLMAASCAGSPNDTFPNNGPDKTTFGGFSPENGNTNDNSNNSNKKEIIIGSTVSAGILIFSLVLLAIRNRGGSLCKHFHQRNHQEQPLMEDANDCEGGQDIAMQSRRVGPPVYTKHLKSGFCIAGDGVQAQLTCEIEGDPDPKIYWRFNSSTIENDNSLFHITKVNEIITLVIRHMCSQMAGIYSCIAENKHGQAVTQATIAVLGKFEDAPEPPTNRLINSHLPVTTPQSTEPFQASANFLFNTDIEEKFQSQFPGTEVKLGPYAQMEDDSNGTSMTEDYRLYAKRMAYHVGQYHGSYLEESHKKRREEVNLRVQQLGFTVKNMKFLSGADDFSSEEEAN